MLLIIAILFPLIPCILFYIMDTFSEGEMEFIELNGNAVEIYAAELSLPKRPFDGFINEYIERSEKALLNRRAEIVALQSKDMFTGKPWCSTFFHLPLACTMSSFRYWTKRCCFHNHRTAHVCNY